MLRRFLLLITAASGLCAQAVRDGVVEVTASRQVVTAATEGVFTVNVNAPASAGLAQVVAQLEPAGIRTEHFRLARYSLGRPASILNPAEPASVSYSFEVRVPAGRMEALSLEMDRLFRKPPAPLVRFSFSAELAPGTASRETARQAALPDLFNEARAKAEAAFAAAGQTPGVVLSLRDDLTSSSEGKATATLTLRMARHAPPHGGASNLGRTVWATTARPLTVAFDVGVIHIGSNKGTEEAVKALAPLGVTAADIASQSSQLTAGDRFFNVALSVSSSFTLSKPAAELPRFMENFAKIPAATRDELGLTFDATLSYSDELRSAEAEKALPVLLEEARRLAEPLARLLGLPLRNPRTILDGPLTRPSVTIPVASYLLGGISYFPQIPTSQVGLTVEFALD